MSTHRSKRLLATFLAILALARLCAVPARAADEECPTCGLPVTVSGDFVHGTTGTNVEIQNVAPGGAAASRQDIHGPAFTVTIADLPPGRYVADFGEVETESNGPGQRVFNVLWGTNLVANNVDIFSIAGGRDRGCDFFAPVDHPGGPLSFTFLGVTGNAKLNAFVLLNATNGVVLSLPAVELAVLNSGSPAPSAEALPPMLWRDHTQPMDARIKDLIGRMRPWEKVTQLRNDAPAIPRLGLPAYNYWNECLHGVARAGIATVFPQAIGMAATWDEPLFHEIGDVIATEARAKHNKYASEHNGDSEQYFGLNFWGPNINIFRDPRWGRGQETYGEDPFLTARLAVAFIQGLQGDDPTYIKAMACAKHFAVHSGPEPGRHRFDAEPPERDFYETYLPQFEAAVREGHVGGVMGAYNAIYGEPACSSTLLLDSLLRKQWGFDGYVVSDCGAIFDIYARHGTVTSAAEAAARAVKAGCDLCCGGDYNSLSLAGAQGLITEREIDAALHQVLEVRFRLGLFDPPEVVPYARIPIDQNDSSQHQLVALRTARESIVLLKNNGLLPLDRAKYRRVAVIGANSDSEYALIGDYFGTPSNPVTILRGIQLLADPGVKIYSVTGDPLAQHPEETNTPLPAEELSNVLYAVKQSDVVIYVGGLDRHLESEEHVVSYDGFNGGDRTRIELPAVQDKLLQALYATGKPVVYVNCSGSAMAIPWEAAHLPAILQAWYPGESGGRAVAEVLFGDTNPSGRLPVTFYASTSDLPPFDDYAMKNRTYRYFIGKPLYAFGHGLSYTRFKYSHARLEPPDGTNNSVRVRVNVKNTGKLDGGEVVQVYFRHAGSSVPQPRLALCGFSRVFVRQGDIVPVEVDVPLKEFRYWDTVKKRYTVESGMYEVLIGGASDDIRAELPLRLARVETP